MANVAGVQMPSSNGVTVEVYDLGGDGPPLILAHATGFHARVLEPLATALAGDFHCYAFDERGHGLSSPPDDLDFKWEGFADDAVATVEGLGLDRPFGFGHSAGGAALVLAEQARPGSFRSLFCYEPVIMPWEGPPPGRTGGNPLAAGARRRRDTFPSRQAAYDNYASKPPFAALDPAALRAYVEHGFEDQPDGSVRLRCRPEHEARVYEMGSQHGAFARLGEVRCPVTVACGEHADTFGPAVIETQASRLPHGRTEVLAGLSHFGPLEDPEAVARAVVRAFQRSGG